MKSILVFIFLMNFTALADDSLTVVAVGEAEREKDQIAVVRSTHSALTKRQSDKLKAIYDLMESDFDFYRKEYEVKKGDFNEISSVGTKYIIKNNIVKSDNLFKLELSLIDNKNKKELFSSLEVIDWVNYRSFGHKLTDQMFRALTGKQSIFQTKILFVSDRTTTKGKQRKEVYIMDFDGFRKQRITHKNAMILSPVISPDNKKVLYSVIESQWKKFKKGTAVRKVQRINLYLYDLVTKKTRLISGLSGINSGAVFNKDGSGIYLTLSNLKNADIYYMDLKTRSKRRVTKHFSDDVDPHMNSDESLLTFLSGRPGKAMIYTLDPKGVEKDVRRISFVGDFNASPRFNPDGTEIVFSSWVDNRFDIYRIGSNGRNLVRLTKNFGSNEEPWYSPDGQFIVFTSQRVITKKRAVQNVYIMDRDGEIIRQITENYGQIYTPRWSNYP